MSLSSFEIVLEVTARRQGDLQVVVNIQAVSQRHPEHCCVGSLLDVVERALVEVEEERIYIVGPGSLKPTWC